MYPGGVHIKLGTVLTILQVRAKPTVTWMAKKNTYYTLIFTDPENAFGGESLHWIVGNIPESDVDKGDEIAEFVGSLAQITTGSHRYVFLVYKQPHGVIKFKENYISNT